MPKRIVSWEEVEQLVRKASYQVRFMADCIVAILRGGLIPAYLVSQHLSIKNILTIGIEHYEDYDKKGKLKVFQPLPSKFVKRSLSVLFVDDIVDTGETLKKIQEMYSDKFKEMEFLSIFYKKGTIVRPRFSAEEIPSDQWVIFPWEKEEAKGTER